MIPSQATSAISWSTTTAPVATPTPAVLGIAPAAPSSRDAQAGLEQRHTPPRAAVPAPARTDTEAADATRQAAELALKQQAQVEMRTQELERVRQRQALQRETVEQLRQALHRVWDASAAVVEHALAQAGDAAPSAQSAQAVKAYEGTEALGAPAAPRLDQRA